MTTPVTLTRAEIKARLKSIPAWQCRALTLTRTFTFKSFPAAIRFVNAVARHAEKQGHHPDIDIRYDKVTLALTTHDAGGLTSKDFDLATQCDRLTS